MAVADLFANDPVYNPQPQQPQYQQPAPQQNIWSQFFQSQRALNQAYQNSYADQQAYANPQQQAYLPQQYQQPSYQQPSYQQQGYVNPQLQAYYGAQGVQLDQREDENVRQDNDRPRFSLSGGTEDMYNGRYRNANLADTLAIEAGKGGEWWMNLPAQFLGEDWKFDASKFDLTNGLDAGDMTQLRNFAASLPGMIPGGILEGLEKGYEAATGAPVQEYREKEGGGYEIADYQLDASQRAAAGVDAFIDLAGTFTGGAGRVVGTLGKAAAKTAGRQAFKEGGLKAGAEAVAKEADKTRRRMQRIENMSKGMIERAWEGAGGKVPKGAIGQTVFDVADEGAEEFVQSYAEDIRNKNLDENSFDRALTGAAWGAVGGAMMSGGMRGLNHIMDKGKNADGSASSSSADANDPVTFDKAYDAVRHIKTDANMVGSKGAQIIGDKLKEQRYAPGAAICKHSGSDNTLDIDQMELGAENIAQVWANGERDRQKLAYAFGTTEERLNEIFNPPVGTTVDVAAALNELIAKKGGAVDVVIGRNPDTKNGGFRIDLARVVNGQSFKLHPMAYAITGSDIDGDQSSVYFDPFKQAPGDASKDLTLDALGYASQMLLDPEGGTNVDWWYAGFDKFVSANRSEVLDIVKSFLEPYTRTFDVNGHAVSAVDYFSQRISDAIDIADSDARNLALSRVFSDIGVIVDEMNTAGEYSTADAPVSSRGAVNQILKSITSNEEALVTHYIEYEAAQIAKNLGDQISTDPVQREEYQRQFSDWEAHGTLGDNKTKVFQMSEALGLISNYLGKKGNPLYRQYGMLRYLAASRPVFNDQLTSLGKIFDSESAVQELLRASFRMAQVGESPTESIEGILDVLMMSEVYMMTGMGSGTVDYAQMKEAFRIVHAKYSKIYNNARKKLTQNGFEIVDNENYRNELPEVGSKEFELQFMRQFNRVFKNVPLSDVVDVSKLPESYRHMTWGEFLDATTKNVYNENINVLVANYGDGTTTANFLKQAVAEVGSINKTIEGELRKVFSGIDTEKILARYEANGNKLDPRDIASMLSLMEAINEVLDDDVSLYLHLFDPNALLETKLGKLLLTGTEDQKINALVSASLYAQFHPLIEDLKSGDDYRVHNARQALEMKKVISPVHAFLAESIQQENYRLLAELTDLDYELQYKVRDWGLTVGESFPTSNFIVDSLNVGSEFSSLSASIKKAKNNVVKFKRACFDDMAKEVNSFEEQIKLIDNNETLVDKFVKEKAADAIIEPNMELMWMKIYSSITLSNKDVEKATITDAALRMFLANQLSMNGNLTAHVDSITAHEHGTCSLEDWAGNRYHLLSCLTDPNYRQWVVDPATNKRYLMTRERMFADANPGIDLSGREPTSREYIAVLKKYPQIAGYLCNAKYNMTASDEQVGVAPGRTGTLSESFSDWQKGVKGTKHQDPKDDISYDYKMKRALQITKSHMYNDPRAHKIVTWMLEEGVLEGPIDMKEGVRSTRNAYDQLARHIYLRASQSSIMGESAVKTRAAEVVDMKKQQLRHLCAQLYTMVQKANQQTAYNADLETQLLEQLVSMTVDLRVLSELNTKYPGMKLDTDAVTAQLGTTTNDVTEMLLRNQRETLDAAMTIMLTIANGEVSLINDLVEFSGNRELMERIIKTAVEQENAANNITMSEEDLQAEVTKRYNEAKSSVSKFDFGDLSDHMLTDDDFKYSDRLEKKLEKLYAHDPNLLEGVKEDVNGFLSAKDKDAYREQLKRVTNQNVVSHMLRQISQLNMMPVNENALQSYNEVMQDLDDMVAEYAEELRDQGIYPSDNQIVQDFYNRHNYSKDMPKMNFANRNRQQSVAQQKVMDPASGSPAKVGVNGGLGKKVAALGHLSQSQTDMDKNYEIETTVADVKNNALTYWRGWHALNANGDYVPIDSPDFLAWVNRQPVDTPITVFDPKDNPHGLATRNITYRNYDPNSRYHRISGIIGRLIDFSQEAMVLKAKKNFKGITRIVTRKNIQNAGDDSVSMSSYADLDDVFDTYQTVFMDAREGYREAIEREFQDGGSMDKIGFHQDQALLLSQFLTPGMIITYQTADGHTEAFVLDADVFFGLDAADKFKQKIEPIIAAGGTIQSAEVMFTTLEENASRVHQAIARARSKKGSPLTKAEAEVAANNAMMDWSDYDIDISADLSEVLSRIPPIGTAYRGQIVAPDSPTGEQIVLDDVFDNGAGSTADGGYRQPKFIGGSDEYKVCQNFGRQLGLFINNDKNAPYTVTRIFRPTTSAGMDAERQDLHTSLGVTLLQDSNVSAPGAVGIVTDYSQLDEAIAWAARTGSGLLVDENLVSDGVIDKYMLTGVVKQTRPLPGSGNNGVRLVEIEPWKKFRYSTPANGSSSSRDSDTSTIFVAAMVGSSMRTKIPGDAEIGFFSNMDRVTLSSNSHKASALSDYLPKNNLHKQILNRVDAKKLLRSVATFDQGKQAWIPVEDDQAWIDAGIDLRSQAIKSSNIKEGSPALKRLIVEYLVDINDNDKPATDPRPSRIARSTVACFVTDGNVVSPVLYPDNMPVNVYYAETRIENGKVVTYYAGDTPLHVDGRESSTKFAILGETFKGMMSRIAGWIPKLGNGREINMIASQDTEGSRVHGMSEELLKNGLYYESRLRHGSLFYNGNKFNDYIESTWSDEDKMLFASTSLDDKFWNRVITQQLKFTNDKAANDVISNVIRICRHYKLDPRHLLSTYRLEMDKEGNLHRINLGSDPSNPNSYKEVDFQMIYYDLDTDQMLKLYHAMDPTLCPNGVGDMNPRNSYLFDKHGNVLIQLEENGDYVSIPARYGHHRVLEESTLERTASGKSAIARQHQQRRAMDTGYLADEIQDALNYEAFVYGDYDTAIDAANEILERKRAKDARTSINPEFLPQYVVDGEKYNFATLREIERISRDKTCIANTMRNKRAIYGPNSTKDKPEIIDPTESQVLKEAVDYFNQKVNEGKDPSDKSYLFTFDFINRLEMFNSASSYVQGSDWYIYESNLANSIREMADNLADPKNPMPVVVKATNSSKLDGRYCIPAITPQMVDLIWEHCPHVRDCHTTKQKFIKAIMDEQAKAEEAIGSLSEKNKANKSKKKALSTMARSAMYQWGKPSGLQTCYEDYTFKAIAEDNNRVAKAIASGEDWTQEERESYQEFCRQSDEKLHALRDYLTDVGYKQVEIDGIMGNITGYNTTEDAKVLSNVLNNAAELSKALAILNPMVTVANITDRVLHQGSMNAAIHIGHKLRIGPYVSDHWINQDIAKKAVNDQLAVRLYASFRAAEFNNEEMLFLQKAVESKNLESILDFLESRKAQMNPFQKGVEWAYQVGSGGNFRLKGQMLNFLNQFVMFAEADGQNFWFHEDPTQKIADGKHGEERNLTYLEAKLASESGFAEFFLECIGAKGKTPSYSIAMKAMNAAKAADMAQRSAASVILAHVCRKMPFGKFLMTTCISRFPAYGINVTGRMLNWILPISSINYVFTEYMSETKLGKEIGLEETQRYASLKQAITADICKLGVGGTAMVLFALSGMIQPPDDEKKWGNVDEWILMGRRVGENWWVQDILGMALPLACFWTAAAQGKPRIDILTNGMANACYSNPILRCSDVASFLINPGESLISDYNEEVKQFADAKGGPPTFDQYLQSNAFSLGMSWLSQFATPSIVREWYQASTPLEKSYKKVYERGPSGLLTEEGALGKTVYTTYDEAIKLKLARRNPTLAFLFSLTSQDGASYWAADMPDTVYYDDYQLDSTQQLTVSGLEGADRMAKVAELIGVLQSYDSMDELAATGFHLDYETLSAVAQQVWDNYHAVDEWYYGLQANGQLDYYVLGNGDKTAGYAIAGQIRQERDTMKQYWYDFYYQKLKNSPIAMKLQAYNRYNTSYARDVYGDIYATGIRKSPYNFLPFVGAPGTPTANEGTAGYVNDFNSVSAVTEEPLSQRALIPYDGTNVDMPDLEFWSGDKKGDQYSQQYQNAYGKAGDTSSSKTTAANPSSGYPRGGGYRSYSNYSGYKRRGGGYKKYPSKSYPSSGRNYKSMPTPNIYASNLSLSPGGVGRVMNTDRIQDANLEYLRPDFETKGSREAYKRSDI